MYLTVCLTLIPYLSLPDLLHSNLPSLPTCFFLFLLTYLLNSSLTFSYLITFPPIPPPLFPSLLIYLPAWVLSLTSLPYLPPLPPSFTSLPLPSSFILWHLLFLPLFAANNRSGNPRQQCDCNVLSRSLDPFVQWNQNVDEMRLWLCSW